MEVHQHSVTDSNYQSILQYMQQYDCSYQQAETRINQSLTQYTDPHHLQQYFNQIDKFQNLAPTDPSILNPANTLSMTQLQIKNLQMFFAGRTNVIQHKNKRSPLYKNASKKWKQLKSQMKCLNCLNPKVIWQRYKRSKKQYKNMRLMQHSAVSEKAGSESTEKKYYEIADKNLKQILQDVKQQLVELLETNLRLVNQLKNISQSGICTSEYFDGNLTRKLKPLVIAKQEAMNLLSYQTALNLEKQLSIVVVSKQKYRLLFSKLDKFSQTLPFTFCFFNIFGELQVIEFMPQISQDKAKQLSKIQMKYLIKNSLFHLIHIGKGNLIKFSVQEHHPYYDYEQFQEQYTPVEQIIQHKTVREQQDMLYQSMLEEHTTRKKSEEIEIKTKNDQKVRKTTLKQKIGEEPTQSDETFSLIFRTPNGSIVCRNFWKNTPLQIVYDWISIQEEIIFEDESQRNFQLVYGYPPKKIDADQSQILLTVFNQEESKVKLIIREI